jgi:predicted house-cleaning NTP pyrophosphatase (Maf/HAM1 superfamily)
VHTPPQAAQHASGIAGIDRFAEHLVIQHHFGIGAQYHRTGEWSETSLSRVRMPELSDAAIAAYIATGEPFGKAGAYAIQGHGAKLIEHLDGSHSGVMGLPVFETARLLRARSLISA